MAEYSEMLGAVELKDIQLGNAVYHDYFYIPVFSSTEYDEDYQSQDFRLEIQFKNGNYDPKGYASKVVKGETLWQTIKSDLQKDFRYTGDFKITSIKPFDSADNKDGEPLDRFLVYVFLFEKFDASIIKPLGLNCRWLELENS